MSRQRKRGKDSYKQRMINRQRERDRSAARSKGR